MRAIIIITSSLLSSPKGTRGVYILNPDIIYKGGNNDRMAVVTISQPNKEQVFPAFEEKDETTAKPPQILARISNQFQLKKAKI